MRGRILLCITGIIFSISESTSAQSGILPRLSGEISEAHDGRSVDVACDIYINGQIDSGVANYAISRIDEISREKGILEVGVCLDSPGGSFEAALQIIEHVAPAIQSGNVTTIIDENMRCESACAFIFMSGINCSRYYCYPSRYMSPGAYLGFHSPDISISGGASEYTIRNAYLLALNQIGRLIAINNYANFFDTRISLSLIEEILTHHGEDFFEVNTIKDTLDLKISLFGKFMDPRMAFASDPSVPLFSACDNSYFIQRDVAKLHTGYGSGGMPWLYAYPDGRHVYFNSLLMSGPHDTWSECYIPLDLENDMVLEGQNSFTTGDRKISATLDSPDRYYSSLEDAYQLSREEISFEEAWGLVNREMKPQDYWLFWPSETKLADLWVK